MFMLWGCIAWVLVLGFGFRKAPTLRIRYSLLGVDLPVVTEEDLDGLSNKQLLDKCNIMRVDALPVFPR